MRKFTTPLITQLKKQLKEAKTPYKNIAKSIFEDEYNMELSYASHEKFKTNQKNVYDLIIRNLAKKYSSDDLAKFDRYLENFKNLTRDQEVKLDEFLKDLNEEINELDLVKVEIDTPEKKDLHNFVDDID